MTTGEKMSQAELVRRFTEEFKNHSNFDVVDEVFSENFVHHLPTTRASR